MAIGRLQKTSGNDLYRWAQECLTEEEEGLQSCARFPRTDREIAAKLLKTCKKGRWGLLFQQMVEQQRIVDGGMPCGRVMLRKIFHHFKLERDRLGMLGERNLLSLRLNGTTLAELEAFRDKYQYIMTTIPIVDLPKEQTLYNHLIDELDRCTTLANKITRSREARPDSKKKTCEWLCQHKVKFTMVSPYDLAPQGLTPPEQPVEAQLGKRVCCPLWALVIASSANSVLPWTIHSSPPTPMKTKKPKRAMHDQDG